MLKYNFVTRFSLLFKRFNCIASCVHLLKCINVRNNEANICTISVFFFCVDGHLPSIMIWSCRWTCNHINMVLGNNLNNERSMFQNMCWINKQFLMDMKFCHCQFSPSCFIQNASPFLNETPKCFSETGQWYIL